jgi:hypothetical protein
MLKIKNIPNNVKSGLEGFALGTVACLLLATTLFLTSKILEHKHKESTLAACTEAYEMLCVQVHACTNTSVLECDMRVVEMKICEQTSLPPVEVINSCTAHLRHIECDQNLPAVCSVFMD